MASPGTVTTLTLHFCDLTRYLIGPSTRLSCYMATETVFSFRRSLPICKGIDAILDLVLKSWGNGELTAGLIPAHSALSKAGRLILADERNTFSSCSKSPNEVQSLGSMILRGSQIKCAIWKSRPLKLILNCVVLIKEFQRDFFQKFRNIGYPSEGLGVVTDSIAQKQCRDDILHIAWSRRILLAWFATAVQPWLQLLPDPSKTALLSNLLQPAEGKEMGSGRSLWRDILGAGCH